MSTTPQTDFEDEEPTLKIVNTDMAELVTQPPPPRTRTKPYPVNKSPIVLVVR